MQTPSDFTLGSAIALKRDMSDADKADGGDLQALQDQVDAEKQVVAALQAQYNHALEELRVALQREVELKALWAELDAHAHSFE